MTDRMAAALQEITDHELFAIAGPLTDLRHVVDGSLPMAFWMSDWPEDPPRDYTTNPTIVDSPRVLELLDALNDWLSEEMSHRMKV